VEVDNPDGGRFSRGMNDEEAVVAGHEGEAPAGLLRRVAPDLPHPLRWDAG
jgi:hypothetical protein